MRFFSPILPGNVCREDRFKSKGGGKSLFQKMGMVKNQIHITFLFLTQILIPLGSVWKVHRPFGQLADLTPGHPIPSEISAQKKVNFFFRMVDVPSPFVFAKNDVRKIFSFFLGSFNVIVLALGLTFTKQCLFAEKI